MGKRVYETHSRGETEELAAKIAEKVGPGTVIAMKGGLGAGKTCFAAGFARGMGYNGDVNSPTFAILNEYLGGRLNIYHFDMYRVNGWDDLDTTGYFECLDSGGVLLIEWSDNIASALPEKHMTVCMEAIGENDRRITVED